MARTSNHKYGEGCTSNEGASLKVIFDEALLLLHEEHQRQLKAQRRLGATLFHGSFVGQNKESQAVREGKNIASWCSGKSHQKIIV